MRFVLEKGLSKIVCNFFSVTTIIFVVLSMFNIENWLLRIFTQGSFCLAMLFEGIHTISHQKEKYKSGYLLIGAAALIFFVMIPSLA